MGIREAAPLDGVVKERMRRQRRRDTAAELAIRRRLHALGYRYRVDTRVVTSLRCRADVVFSRRRIAVFIDGCFWHGCPDHFSLPKNNSEWWEAKLRSNKARDRANRDALRAMGWCVIEVWEHEPLESAVARIVVALDAPLVLSESRTGPGRAGSPAPESLVSRVTEPRFVGPSDGKEL